MRSLLKVISVDNSEPTPLMEGEGRSFRVLGFNQNQRAIFVQTLMRYLLSDKAFRHKKRFCLYCTFLSPVHMVYMFLSSGQKMFRYGVGNYDWKEFVPRLKQKTYDEIKEY